MSEPVSNESHRSLCDGNGIYRIQSKLLNYGIHEASSTRHPFKPENVMVNRPSNRMSRWCTDASTSPQYLTLRLTKPSLVEHIRFGKFEGDITLGLKTVRIYGGLEENKMSLLLDTNLKKNTVMEAFTFRRQRNGRLIPCNFIKIEPVESWSNTFIRSVWCVQLFGYDNLEVDMAAETEKYQRLLKREAFRSCLKFLRQENLRTAFFTLSISLPDVKVEHPLLSSLHAALVDRADFTECESLILEMSRSGLLTTGAVLPRELLWRRIVPEFDGIAPSSRAGHQMVLCPRSRAIYLFGGWSGESDLADFWRYRMDAGVWDCLSEDTSAEGGPTARSCHKMCIDSCRGKIYVLGKYVSHEERADGIHCKNDFYCYDTDADMWIQLSENVLNDGGPKLVYDHQMVINERTNTIYVYGGKMISSNRETDTRQHTTWAGFYFYKVSSGMWHMIQRDGHSGISRSGHSMLLHPDTEKLYVFGGGCNGEVKADVMVFDTIDNHWCMVRDQNIYSNQYPAYSYMQRATLDPDRNEIYVFSGLSKPDMKTKKNSRTSFWVYDILSMNWSCINEGSETLHDNKSEPMPRYAHQIVYEPETRMHYLFGGNPSQVTTPSSQCRPRLDDFWSLQLRPSADSSPEGALQRCQYLLRRQHYRHLLEDGTCLKYAVEALSLLQNQIYEVANFENKQQHKELQTLASWAVKGTLDTEKEHHDWAQSASWRREHDRQRQRRMVWESICEFVGPEHREPEDDLTDFIRPIMANGSAAPLIGLSDD